MSRGVTIRPGHPEEEGAAALLRASRALMRALFPQEADFSLPAEALDAPDILFFVAELNGRTAGCAALRLRPGYGEVKSMFVDPACRGARIGARLLARLEAEARARGLSRLMLETGDRLTAAQRLYLSEGFSTRGPFGDYRAHPDSLFMEKRL